VTYDVEGPEPVKRRSLTKPVRTAIVLGLLAVAVVVAFNWGWQQLTQPFGSEDTAATSATPTCTPAPEAVAALPAPDRITVNVYNASGRSGVAASTAEALRAEGFRIGAVDNDPLGKRLDGVGEIRSAPKAKNRVDQLQRFVPGTVWVQDDRPGRNIDFAVGASFTELARPEPPPENPVENTEDDIPTC
jgi:hypothetical protein